MDGIGESLREARLSSGVSLEEVSRDLGLNVLILENIESGKIGAFKNVLELNRWFDCSTKATIDNKKNIIPNQIFI